MTTYQIVYSSLARDANLSQSDLKSMLRAFRARNARRGITGILLHSHGRFLQMLEGDKDQVDQLFASIAGDHRHYDLVPLNLSFPHRLFGEWSMAFASVDETIPGFAGARSSIDLHAMDEAMVGDLLAYFSDKLSAKTLDPAK